MVSGFKVLFLSLVIVPAAFAEVSQPEESTSRGLELAKRVAALENSRDIPSRTGWMVQRAAEAQRRLACQAKGKRQKKKACSSKDVL